MSVYVDGSSVGSPNPRIQTDVITLKLISHMHTKKYRKTKTVVILSGI